ncbi:PREDICTED: odorant receptor 4-like [Dinoponera quadriceps]|uniref:Odorant receptor n=1 Tax=Dinoponera quadriceps TaxID=609295 RepID=A0A6P3XNM7_DINQU|nr:PREDICTED: odorant receptor 4-like [Dinoponera quadriceps]
MTRKSTVMARKNTISRMVEILLPMFGVWPGRPCVIIFRVFWVASAVFVEFCHYRYFVSHLSAENFFDLVDCLCSFLAHGKVITKLIMFWVNQRKLMETLALMTDDWSDRANNNDAGMHMMARKAKTCNRITNAIMILHTMTIVTYCTGMIIADVNVTDQTTEVPYINKVQMPFRVDTQPMYRFVLIAEYVHMIISNWGAGIANAILLTLILHVGGQMDILQRWLSELASKDLGSERESIARTASKIIQKHQRIIYFSENIENLYTHIALFLFASNTILICSLGFLIVTAIGSPDATEQIMKSLLFYTSTNLEAFLFCFAGEYLNNKSKKIGFAAYNCAWYNLKPKESRILLFIILRSQRQLTLTAGKMMDLTLESFASIMNASGSYLSVLLAMQ